MRGRIRGLEAYGDFPDMSEGRRADRPRINEEACRRGALFALSSSKLALEHDEWRPDEKDAMQTIEI